MRFGAWVLGSAVSLPDVYGSAAWVLLPLQGLLLLLLKYVMLFGVYAALTEFSLQAVHPLTRPVAQAIMSR